MRVCVTLRRLGHGGKVRRDRGGRGICKCDEDDNIGQLSTGQLYRNRRRQQRAMDIFFRGEIPLQSHSQKLTFSLTSREHRVEWETGRL